MGAASACGMADGPPWRDPETLEQLYHGERMTVMEVADELGCSQGTISRWMGIHDIEVRDRSVAVHEGLTKNTPPLLKDPGRLRQLYVEQGLSSFDIADIAGVTYKTVTDWLRRHGIGVRSTKESHHRKTPDELRNADRLRELYDGQGLTDRQIADKVGVGQPTVTRWRNVHGIDARLNPSGPDHPSWKEGTDKIYYGRGWDAARRQARERDDNTCQRCGAAPDDHNLDVHHIQPVESFDNPEDAHFMDNLVTLCRPCHRRWEGIPLRPMNGD